MKRSPPPRRTVALGRRKGKARRTRAPLPLPPVGGSTSTPLEHEGDAVAFGRQAELCRGTVCCACWAAYWRTTRRDEPIDWSLLPAIVDGRSEAHHEPPRGLRSQSDDDDTIPLCRLHHGRKGGPARRFAVRHSDSFDANPEAFYVAANVGDWRAVRDEMRRRVSLAASAAEGVSRSGAYPVARVVTLTEPAGAGVHGDGRPGPGGASTTEETP